MTRSAKDYDVQCAINRLQSNSFRKTLNLLLEGHYLSQDLGEPPAIFAVSRRELQSRCVLPNSGLSWLCRKGFVARIGKYTSPYGDNGVSRESTAAPPPHRSCGYVLSDIGVRFAERMLGEVSASLSNGEGPVKNPREMTRPLPSWNQETRELWALGKVIKERAEKAS